LRSALATLSLEVLGVRARRLPRMELLAISNAGRSFFVPVLDYTAITARSSEFVEMPASGSELVVTRSSPTDW
jgi:hypothetical protein